MAEGPITAVLLIGHEPRHDVLVGVEAPLRVRYIVRLTRLLVELSE